MVHKMAKMVYHPEEFKTTEPFNKQQGLESLTTKRLGWLNRPWTILGVWQKLNFEIVQVSTSGIGGLGTFDNHVEPTVLSQ